MQPNTDLLIAPQNDVSFAEAVTLKNETIWKQLNDLTVETVLHYWLGTLKSYTRSSYASGFKIMSQLGIIQLGSTLQHFSMVNHEQVVDEIKLITDWSEATRQARAAAYISFTGFLQRRTQGIVKKDVANREGTNKTFFKVREKVKTEALDPEETKIFIKELEKLNQRDALIAKLILQGGKRKSEVLELKTNAINYARNQITYIQTKTRGMEKVTVINYPPHVMEELKKMIGNRRGYVFVTRNLRKIAPYQIDRNFLKAGELAGIPFRVTPHVLRVTLVTRLKEMKVQDTDIMKITGHANPAQLASYDKSDLGDNATAAYQFV